MTQLHKSESPTSLFDYIVMLTRMES